MARLVLTASGGPFRGRSRTDLASVTIDDALAHPTWTMGPKITVDSSTLMNKGLEVIEAHELFGIGYDQIDVVVHPESIVHSMVTFRDGSTIAQLSDPDMRLPIGYAMGAPDRLPTAFGALDWAAPRQLNFESPDRRRLPGAGSGLRRRRPGRRYADVAKRRQRGGRGRVLARADPLAGDRAVIEEVVATAPDAMPSYRRGRAGRRCNRS